MLGAAFSQNRKWLTQVRKVCPGLLRRPSLRRLDDVTCLSFSSQGTAVVEGKFLPDGSTITEYRPFSCGVLGFGGVVLFWLFYLLFLLYFFSLPIVSSVLDFSLSVVLAHACLFADCDL